MDSEEVSYLRHAESAHVQSSLHPDRRSQRMAAAHELEMKHEKHIHQAQLIAKEEDARRQKVTKQVLLAENSTLREQLAEKDAQINQLTDKCDETRSELDSLKATSHDQQTQIKSQTREFANIKVGPCREPAHQ